MRDRPALLVHLVTADDWAEVVRRGVDHRPPGFDQLGFVHLSAPEQAHLPAGRLFAGRRDLLAVWVDPAACRGELRWEEGVPPEGDLRFPHLYGPLELSAVRSVVPYRPGPDGRFDPSGPPGPPSGVRPPP